MIISAIRRQYLSALRDGKRLAYTLVEILVVLFVLMLLAAIALPTVKDLLVNQKTNRAARNLVAFIDKARSRAVAEQQYFGVLIERGVGNAEFSTMSQAIRVRNISGVPPYAGDASNSYAELSNAADRNYAYADFTVRDNLLLELSRRFYKGEEELGSLDQVPIRNGDYLELPGGRMVPITILPDTVGSPAEPMVRLVIPMTDLYPDGSRDFPTAPKPRMKYRIHRHPVVSAATPFSMPRGVVIDLNFSGFGVSGNQFAGLLGDPTNSGDIEIVFGPDGSVQRVTEGAVWKSGTLQWSRTQVAASGALFLCVGDFDGLWSSDTGLFSTQKKTLSNLLNLESIWVTINPYTGRCNASPMAPLATTPTANVLDPNPEPNSPDDQILQTALLQARYFATLSDSVDPE